MSLFVPKRVRPKKFSYEPRYYDPTREEDLKRRIRVQRYSRAARRGRFTGLIYFVALLLFALYIYNLLD